MAKKKNAGGPADGDGNSVAENEQFDAENAAPGGLTDAQMLVNERPRKVRDPNAKRSYYAVFGIDRTNMAESLLSTQKTRRRADAWVREQGALLRMLCSSVRICRVREVG